MLVWELVPEESKETTPPSLDVAQLTCCIACGWGTDVCKLSCPAADSRCREAELVGISWREGSLLTSRSRKPRSTSPSSSFLASADSRWSRQQKWHDYPIRRWTKSLVLIKQAHTHTHTHQFLLLANEVGLGAVSRWVDPDNVGGSDVEVVHSWRRLDHGHLWQRRI